MILRPALVAAAFAGTALADGIGILGAGKWLYKPVCAHTCRYLLRNSQLLCTADDSGGAHHGHSSSSTDPVCFLHDAAFLRTVALCIDDFCDESISTIEEYWEGHLATGTIGDWSEDMRPVMTYQEALRLAKEDVEDVGKENVPVHVVDDPLNVTSFLSGEDFVPTRNYQMSFEWGEVDHGANSLIISITSVALPIVLSMCRFLPGYSRWQSRLNSFLDQPLWGQEHRVPVMGNFGLMPTRGQSLFIAYITIINVVLLCLPLRTIQPNVRMESHHMQQVQMIGDRAGVLAFSLYVALFLFSSRNNILLWITNWSHSTFLMLHRWIAYACLFQTIMHSILLLHYFVKWQDHTAESQLPYWYWGIIATLATCLMWPLSILPIRQKMYEVFLAIHQLLAAFVLITAFLHIWYLYEWDWGYEIWIYIAGGLWFCDRLLRLLRIASNGKRTATVTTIDAESDLLRVEIDGVVADGHVYLYFPSLSWRVWESHPFSILSSHAGGNVRGEVVQNRGVVSNAEPDPEKKIITPDPNVVQRSNSSSSTEAVNSSTTQSPGPRAVILVRPQTGTTKALLERARAAGGKLSLSVLIESSYHANPSARELTHCSTLIGIAGGVGITAVLPMARTFGGTRSRVWWGAKHDDIIRAIQPEVLQLGPSVELETVVGSRLPVSDILRDELLREDEKGNVGVVVCGPASMADDVRRAVGELVISGKAKRGVVFVDEAFSW